MSYKDGLHSNCKPCVIKKTQELKQRWKEEREHLDPPTEKLCTQCYRIFPIAFFCGNIRTKDGFDNICKGCLKKKRNNYSARWKKDRETSSPKTEKTCPGCKQTLPTSAFYAYDALKDGWNNYCIDCSQRLRREYTGKWEKQRAVHTKTPATKKCNLCHRTMPIEKFYSNRLYKDGFTGTCIICEERRSQEYMQQWTEESTTIPKEKQCQGCNKTLPLDQFRRNKRKKDGHDYLCKDCTKLAQEKYSLRWSKERESKNKDDFNLFPTFEKTCCVCHETKPLAMFYERKNAKDGHNASCKKCDLERTKVYIEKQKARPKIIPKNKVCSACKQLLPASKFNKSKHRKDGLDIHCKDCHNKKHKEYQAKPEVKNRMKEWKKNYNKKPEVREKQQKRARKYSKRPYVKAKMVAYNKKHRALPEVKLQRQQNAKEYYKRKKMKTVDG